MIRIRLPPQEVEHLESVLRATTDAKLRTRVQIVLMAHRGRPHGQIASDTGTSRSTVQRWPNAYLERGPGALRPRKPGRPRPKLTAELAPVLRSWVIEGPKAQGSDRANWTHAELAEHLFRTHGVRVGKSAMQVFCRKHESRPYRPTHRFLRGDPEKRARAREDLADSKRGAEAGELVPLSQDEARFPMVPTLGPTPGVKGHRPTVGTRACKDLLYVFAVVNVVTGVLHANALERPARAKQKAGKSKTRRMQQAFAAHLRHVARLYPVAEHQRVVLIIDNAPWHRGVPIDEALAEHPHLEFYRLPSYSPQLNAIERFWRLLRRRATHDRLFDTLADLKRSLRASLCYYQTVRCRPRALITGCYAPKKDQSPTPG